MAQLPRGDKADPTGRFPIGFDSLANSFHAYVHVPYCLTRCGYCDFNTYTASELAGNKREEYFELVLREIELSKKAMEVSGFEPKPISTVFFGGGTPTLLASSDLLAILESLRTTFGFVDHVEITTEANPDSVDENYLAELKANGFTRISFGMQSEVDHVLKVLERTHNPENVAKNVAIAKALGFQVSVDLIYGSPGETLSDWQKSLDAAVAMDTDHISAYSLIVEPGTKLHRQIASGELAKPDEDLHALMYEAAEASLVAAGFHNYEVSNWAKNIETRSKHNIAYWQSKNWWGYGPGAHSHISGTRFWNVKHPAAYAERLNSGLSPALEMESISDEDRKIEKVMLELRLVEGMSLSELKGLGFASSDVIAGLIADGLVIPEEVFKDLLKLSLRGRLLADLVIRKVLGF
ncbi:MAG: radical SAM family heme chaperone HemW [Rhodoluna sp.]